MRLLMTILTKEETLCGICNWNDVSSFLSCLLLWLIHGTLALGITSDTLNKEKTLAHLEDPVECFIGMVWHFIWHQVNSSKYSLCLYSVPVGLSWVGDWDPKQSPYSFQSDWHRLVQIGTGWYGLTWVGMNWHVLVWDWYGLGHMVTQSKT